MGGWAYHKEGATSGLQSNHLSLHSNVKSPGRKGLSGQADQMFSLPTRLQMFDFLK